MPWQRPTNPFLETFQDGTEIAPSGRAWVYLKFDIPKVVIYSQAVDSRRLFFFSTGLVGIFLLVTNILGGVLAQNPSGSVNSDQAKRLFSNEELSAFDGREGRPAYFAYQGKTYDVTASPLFTEGEHFEHRAGQDLTGQLEGAPHLEEVFEGIPVVGLLKGKEAEALGLTKPGGRVLVVGQYEAIRFGRIAGQSGATLVWGKTIGAWTGYLLGLVFILNFSTCFAMPWAKFRLPWQESPPLTHYHKPLAYLTVVFGILHGIFGILASFGIYF